MPNGTAERVFNWLGMRQDIYLPPSAATYAGEKKNGGRHVKFSGSIAVDIFSFSAELNRIYPFPTARISTEFPYTPKMKPSEVARRIRHELKQYENSPEHGMKELVEECTDALKGIEALDA